MSNIEIIKSIRNKTNLSFKDIKKAVEELNTDDEEKIIDHLRKQGSIKNQSRQDRKTAEGSIFSYIHEGRVGVMLEIRCETDFVARSDQFKEMGNDIALHIVANQPAFVSPDQVSQEFVDKEMEIARDQLKNEGKPEDKIEMILEGKKKKLTEEVSLLTQPFLKDPKITVKDLVDQVAQATGEKIEIGKFVIYTL